MRNPLQRGYTLFDLLVTLALIALLAAIAAPNLTQLVESNRQHALLGELQRSLQEARARAILEGRTIEICAYSTGEQCGEDWNKGWILRASRTKEILSVKQSTRSEGTLRWSGYSTTIRFRPNGTSPTGNGRFTLCAPQAMAWQLVINRQGRIRSASNSENQNEQHRCP
ncbi:MAG: GspH/FimT family protein [Pseudomonas sp.]|uniref:GspH/FimT family protein n=1 Tax=Pseudomonas sp. TaxID=306 RepID=UPI003D0E9A5B